MSSPLSSSERPRAERLGDLSTFGDYTPVLRSSQISSGEPISLGHTTPGLWKMLWLSLMAQKESTSSLALRLLGGLMITVSFILSLTILSPFTVLAMREAKKSLRSLFS